VVAAVKAVGLQVPLVVRLEGTNVELGKKIIRESGLNVCRRRSRRCRAEDRQRREGK
jgi:succinyl-CoA synthetase beta subunit